MVNIDVNYEIYFVQVKLNTYVESKKETENLRKQLLKLMNDEKPITDSLEIPNNEEKNLIKYYYYIHQGVDIVNIAPLEKAWIENILSRIPPKLKLKQNLMDEMLLEVQVGICNICIVFMYLQSLIKYINISLLKILSFFLCHFK